MQKSSFEPPNLTERLEMWGYHCNDLETGFATLTSLLKTAEKATLVTGLERDDITAINYTLSMCSELAVILEKYAMPLHLQQIKEAMK